MLLFILKGDDVYIVPLKYFAFGLRDEGGERTLT